MGFMYIFLINIFESRQRMGKVINDVELTAISLRIEQFVYELDHKVTHPFDSLRSELMRYHATEAVVIMKQVAPLLFGTNQSFAAQQIGVIVSDACGIYDII